MKILALTLQTNNLKATEEFYSTTLGLQLVEKTERSLSYAVHFSRLTFELTEAEVCPTYHFAFNISLNKMQEALTWLSTRVQLIPYLHDGKDAWLQLADGSYLALGRETGAGLDTEGASAQQALMERLRANR